MNDRILDGLGYDDANQVRDYDPAYVGQVRRMSSKLRARIIHGSRVQVVRPGETILPATNNCGILVYIVRGCGSIIMTPPDNRPLWVGMASAHQWYGETGYFLSTEAASRARHVAEGMHGNTKTAVTAETECVVRHVTYRHAEQLCREYDELYRVLSCTCCLRLKATTHWLSEYRALPLQSMVYNLLLRLSFGEAWQAPATPSGQQVRISRTRLAYFLGCSRESVGRCLHQLVEDKKIMVSGKTMLILHPYYFRV